jgi:hypothetical protein
LLLPEISPPDISNNWVESEAQKVLDRYLRAVDQTEAPLPVPIDDAISRSCRLSTEYRDFEKEEDIRSGSGGMLCGGLYPEG